MANKWTDMQRAVIDSRNKNVLVSAAAGSGKTAVLTQRILELILDEKDPANIDDFLIVTFTRAAADEMRERIRKNLEKAYEEHPGNHHILLQLTRVHSADIMTIHSFCMQIVRNHFQQVNLDPAFRVGEDGELKLLQADVLDDLLEELYTEGDEEFLSFSRKYAPGRNDKKLADMVLDLYNHAVSEPWPEEWLNSLIEEKCIGEESHPKWIDMLLDSIRDSLHTYLVRLELALDMCRLPYGPAMNIPVLESDIEQVKAIAEAPAYDDMYRAAKAFSALRWKPITKHSEVDPELGARVKNIRDVCKKAIVDIINKFFTQTLEEVLAYAARAAEASQVLISVTLKFMDRYLDAKVAKNIVDFSDLEHYALEILYDRKDGERIRSEEAGKYSRKYREIFIDEYQDSNYVQEILLEAVSKEKDGGHNRFMVGDVKQSIYSFRKARPELFIEKFETYRRGMEGCVRYDLNRNFRSRVRVLDGINFIFRQCMQHDVGSISYDRDAALYAGAEYKGEDPDTELYILETGEGRPEEHTARELEAKMAATSIVELMENGTVQDGETGELRRIRYSDIVILLRTAEGWADDYKAVLEQEGIPCRTVSHSGYYDSYEVRLCLHMLRIIDNPRQDIALTAVMRSVIGGFNENELALIRSGHSDGFFYQATEKYLQDGEDEILRQKLSGFYGKIDAYRTMAEHMTIHELLWDIYENTGLEAYAQAMPGGNVRRANLEMLLDKAFVFENSSYSGIYHFIRYIDRLIKYEVDEGMADSGENRPDEVEILTIHKSKGLEFPIVILGGMGKGFNEMDSKMPAVTDRTLGIGMDYINEELGVKVPVLKRRVIINKMHQDTIGEELRILYVAMTRAKEKLIMLGTVKNMSKSMEGWYLETANPEVSLTYDTRLKSGSYLDFVMNSLIRNKCMDTLLTDYGLESAEDHLLHREDCGIRVHMVAIGDLVWDRMEQEITRAGMTGYIRAEIEKGENAGSPGTDSLKEELRARIHPTYPYEAWLNVPVKVSVSELKHQHMKMSMEDGDLLLPEGEAPVSDQEDEAIVPAFLKKEEHGLKGSRRGDAYHHLMELLPFDIDPDAPETMERIITGLVSSGRMTDEESECIKREDIVVFLKSDLGRRMSRAYLAGRLYREQPFVMGIPAGEVREEYKGCPEDILIQGIIDGFFYEGDEIVLMDYKTDHLFKDRQYLDRYETQLLLYKRALEQSTGRRVKEIWIYSFTLGRMIPVGA